MRSGGSVLCFMGGDVLGAGKCEITVLGLNATFGGGSAWIRLSALVVSRLDMSLLLRYES